MSLFDTLTTQLAGPVGYVGVLTLLVACGMGVPVPEDIILISGGFIAQAAGHEPWGMMAVGLVGILAGDSVIYFFGYHFGESFANRPFMKRFLTPERLDRVRVLFKNHGEKMIMAARFMPGVRAVTFFTAGTTRVPYFHFAFFDGLAALVSAPLWVFLGYKFGGRVVEWAHQFQSVLIGVMVLIAVFIAVRIFQSRRKPTPAPLPGPNE
jgi:membrane protein DedA with SNARE-associated domain